MNKFLLFSAALTLSASVQAQEQLNPVANLQVRQFKGAKSEVVRSADKHTVVVSKNGVAIKRISPVVANKTVRPVVKHAAARVEAQDEQPVLFESFEGWDGTTVDWVPEGWAVESNGDASLEPAQKWGPCAQLPYYPGPTDGQYLYGIGYCDAEQHQDEWLISPEFTPGENMNLFFDLYLDPLFFYDLSNMDWDTMSFVGDPQVAFTIKVNVREEGGEWTTLKDYAEQFKTLTPTEMMNYNATGSLMPQTIDLSAYAGKKIQFALQYVGADGQDAYVDHFRVSYPELAAPVYMMPLSTQYWGFDRELSTTQFSVAALPVYEDLIFSSYDYVENGTYTWSYNDPADADNWLSADGDMLMVSYAPDYTSEFTTRNNLYFLPSLTVSAPAASPATYTNPATYMQIGGKAEFKFSDVGLRTLSYYPFNVQHCGSGIYTHELDFGKAFPLFGYDATGYSTQFWNDYTFQGESDENNYVKMNAICNMVYPSATTPMVVTGINVAAITANIGANVEFKAQIFPMVYDEEAGGYLPDFSAPIASATMLGSQIAEIQEYGDKHISSLGFDFAEPVVLQATEEAAGYVIAISGFNNPEVGYFAPMQQNTPDDVPMAMGWIYKDITWNGETRWSITPLSDPESGEPLFTSFCIGLEGWLPWLHCEEESLEVGSNGSTLGLDSYYDAADLTVTAPEWANATLTGRYGETMLTVTAPLSATDREGDLVITGKGVSKTIHLTQAKDAGIEGVIADSNDAVVAVYNLAGQPVDAATLPAGIYLVKHASGAVTKVAVK